MLFEQQQLLHECNFIYSSTYWQYTVFDHHKKSSKINVTNLMLSWLNESLVESSMKFKTKTKCYLSNNLAVQLRLQIDGFLKSKSGLITSYNLLY